MKGEKPFVKMLSSPSKGYFFDVNKNEIVAVDDDIYQYLKCVIDDNDTSMFSDSTKEKISQLQELGYLSSKRVKKIRHPYLDSVNYFLDRKVQKVTLQLTQNCNFRCKYCHYTSNDGTQRNHANKKMSLELAKKSVDFLLEHSVDSEEVNVGFYGGEPLLEFKLIKEIVKYSEEIFEGKSLTFTITTNATLLTDEIVEYFIKHNVNMMVSLDGPREINDKNRIFAINGKGTFDVVFSKIKHIYDKYPKYSERISVSMVMDPQNDFDEINSLFKKYDLFNKLRVRSTLIDDVSSDKKNVFSEKYVSKYEYQKFLTFLHSFNRIEREKISPICYQSINITKNSMDEMFSSNSLPDTTAPGGPCIPGEMRLFISVDGTFYPCERVSETSEAMKIGNIETGFDFEKIHSLLDVGSLTSKECRDCWAFNRCNLCAKYADDGNKLSSDIKLKFCDKTRNDVYVDLTQMILLKEAMNFYE